jgi:hypothetical protein
MSFTRPVPALVVVSVFAIALCAGGVAAARADEINGHAALVPPTGPSPPSPLGRMNVEVRPADAGHAESSHFKVAVAALADTAYTMWADDPATADATLVQFDSFTTGHDGHATLDYDTRDGDPMPFGADLVDLGGKAIEMHDGSNATILEGTIPVAAGPSRPVVFRGVTDLTRPPALSPEDFAGRVRAEDHQADATHDAWSRLRIELRGVGDGVQLTLWGDDPATPAEDLVQFGTITADAHGHARFLRDTKKGDPLPFDASLADLAGKALEVQDDGGVAILVGSFPALHSPPARFPPLRGRGDLLPPGGAPPPPPAGRIDETVRAADAGHAERSLFRLRVEHLAADAEFTLWGDDPATSDAALTQFGSLTTGGTGRGAFVLDSQAGDPMPFGAALPDLAGKAVEVRDAGGAAVLVGEFPALPSPPEREPVLRGRANLTRPVDSESPNSVGRIVVEVHPATDDQPEWSRLRIELRGLAPFTQYTLFADDPATADATLVQFATLTTDGRGRVRATYDTRKSGALPFDATLIDLGGKPVEVRDAGDVVVLSGNFPTPQ